MTTPLVRGYHTIHYLFYHSQPINQLTELTVALLRSSLKLPNVTKQKPPTLSPLTVNLTSLPQSQNPLLITSCFISYLNYFSKIVELEEQLRIVGNAMKSLEASSQSVSSIPSLVGLWDSDNESLTELRSCTCGVTPSLHLCISVLSARWHHVSYR